MLQNNDCKDTDIFLCFQKKLVTLQKFSGIAQSRINLSTPNLTTTNTEHINNKIIEQ